MRHEENTEGMSAEQTRSEMRSRFDAVNEIALNKRRVSRGEITAEELEASQSAAHAAAADPWAMNSPAASETAPATAGDTAETKS